jgi:PAS domain S-box-containing protein
MSTTPHPPPLALLAAAITDGARDGVVVLDHGGHVVFWNASAERIFGWSQDEAVGRSVLDLAVPPARREAHRQMFARGLARRQRSSPGRPVERQAVRKDGSTFVVELSITELTVDAASYFSVVARDVEERHRVKVELEWQLALHSTLVSLTPSLASPTVSVEEVARRVLDAACNVTRSPDGSLSCVGPTVRMHLTCSAVDGPEVKDGGGVPWVPDPWSRAAAWSNQAQEVPGPGRPDAVKVRRHVRVPVVVGEETVGLIVVANAKDDYTGRDVEALQCLADSFALAITRSRLDQELLRERTRAQELLEIVPAAIVALDRDGVVTLVNRPGCALLGREAQEVVGSPWVERFLAPEDRERAAQDLRDVRAGVPGAGDPKEMDILTRSGERRTILWRTQPLRGEDGALGTLSSGMDVTERHRAREALAHSEERFRSLFNLAADGIVLLDDAWRITDVNPAWCHRLLARSSDLVGRSLEDVVAPEFRPFLPAQLDAARREGTAVFESVHVALDGTQVPVEVAVRVVPHHRGVLGLCTIRDTSDRKRAERELLRLNESLERRVTDRTAALMREVLERRRTEMEVREQRARLRHVAAQLSVAEEQERRRVAALLHDGIGQTLALARIKIQAAEAARPPQRLAAPLADARDLVVSAIHDTRVLVREIGSQVLHQLGLEPALRSLCDDYASRHGLTCRFLSDDAEKPTTEPIKVLVFQAVRELLFNVVKHAQASQVWVHCRREGRSFTVAVEDDGKGVGEALPEPGTGFGLFSIGERLAHLGGRLGVGARPGGGTVVTLVVPVLLEAESPLPDP